MVTLSDESHELRASAPHARCTATTPYEFPHRVVAPLAAADGMEPLLLEYVPGVLVPWVTGRRSRPSSDSRATPTRGCVGRRRTR
ncbi:hypothetical protein [Streptomyces virginiae]|uniref:hypothetical protein n=1 Tax=Streptomyces virginiae TaxID=1961 RepID=UPI00362EB8C7